MTAKANDTSSASRSSFFFRLGRFCAIEEMTDERTKSSGVRIAREILFDQHLLEWSYRMLAPAHREALAALADATGDA